MPSNRDKKLAVREKLILETAFNLIDRIGFADLTMDILADEAGVAKATLYQHFKNKEDLAIRCARRAFENLEAFLAQIEGRPIAHLQAIFEFTMRGGNDPDAFPSTVMQTEMLRLFRDDAEMRQHFLHVYGIFNDLIDRAKADGDIAPNLHNDIVINLLMGTSGLLQPSITPTSNYWAQDALEQGLQILFNGFKPAANG